MKKLIAAWVIIASLVFLVNPVRIFAAPIFTRTLSYGLQNDPDVVLLQKFLLERGFFAESITGNYFTITQNAVRAFQASVGIDATGFFGPQTMARVNVLAESNTVTLKEPEARISSLLRTNDTSSLLASVISSRTKTKTLTWKTVSYPKEAGVDINLLRKVGDTPVQFEFVRKIVINTPNDGKYSWATNKNEDAEKNLFLEIACTSSYVFVNGCGIGGAPIAY